MWWQCYCKRHETSNGILWDISSFYAVQICNGRNMADNNKSTSKSIERNIKPIWLVDSEITQNYRLMVAHEFVIARTTIAPAVDWNCLIWDMLLTCTQTTYFDWVASIEFVRNLFQICFHFNSNWIHWNRKTMKCNQNVWIHWIDVPIDFSSNKQNVGNRWDLINYRKSEKLYKKSCCF